MRILIVEQGSLIEAQFLRIFTTKAYIIDSVNQGSLGITMMRSTAYDLILLDVLLPDNHAISFCQHLRGQENWTPILMVNPSGVGDSVVESLNSGADDYIQMPIRSTEFQARIEALLRRPINLKKSALFKVGQLCVNPQIYEVTYAGKRLNLRPKEFSILELFLRHPERLYSRSALLDHLWDYDRDLPDEMTVKSHIRSLRKSLQSVEMGDLIETVYGLGYRINSRYRL